MGLSGGTTTQPTTGLPGTHYIHSGMPSSMGPPPGLEPKFPPITGALPTFFLPPDPHTAQVTSIHPSAPCSTATFLILQLKTETLVLGPHRPVFQSTCRQKPAPVQLQNYRLNNNLCERGSGLFTYPVPTASSSPWSTP